jgi:lysozyme
MKAALILKALERLIDEEDIKSRVYHDSKGVLTFGIGHNGEEKDLRMDAILLIAQHDLEDAAGDLVVVFGREWELFSENRQLALLDMMFNLGLPKFAQFSLMIVAIHRRDWAVAAAEALNSEWAKQVGSRAVRIADLLRNG